MLKSISYITHMYAVYLVTEVSAAERVPRGTGDQPSLGNCLSFTSGGISRLHWYSCCNNCKNGVNSTCLSIYQSASKEQYCNKCGRDTKKGNGKPRSDGQQFNCGGCQGQANVDRKCRSWWKEIPGFCWAYSLCFKKQCEGKYKNCGNRVCDDGETKDNCPIDCCDEPCCGEPGCCAGISRGERRLLLPNFIQHIMAVVVLTFISP